MNEMYEKYERLKSAFEAIKAERDLALQSAPSTIYVHTPASRLLNEYGRYIFIGRKGSGKTALVDQYKLDKKTEYDIVIDIIADQDNSWVLYNFFYQKFHDIDSKIRTNDIKDVFDMLSLFTTAWVVAIQITIMERVIRNKKSLGGRYDPECELIKDYLVKEFDFDSSEKSKASSKVQNLLPIIFELIQDDLNEMFIGARTVGILLSRVTKWLSNEIETRLIDETVNDALYKIISEQKLNILITLDKYDDYVDALIVELDDHRSISTRLRRSLDKHERLEERDKMLSFQRNMLRGLIVATKELRRSNVYKDLHFAFAIPQDRFSELRLRETAELDVSHIKQIKWNPLHLLEFFVRRCHYAMGIKKAISSHNDLLSEYKKIIKGLNIAEFIPNTMVRDNRMDFLLCLIRHSMWRPRDIQRYIVEIFKYCQARPNEEAECIDQKTIHDVLRNISPEIIESEFFFEYQVEYPFLEDVINRFRQAKNVLTDEELREGILGKRDISLNHHQMANDEIITRLYSVGFLGIRSKRHMNKAVCIRQQNQLVYYLFYYNDDIKNINTRYGGGAMLSDNETWVIHPLFYDRLDCKVTGEFVVHELTWPSIIEQYGSSYMATKAPSLSGISM